MRTILDTHAWVWWATEDSRLSRTALKSIRASSRAEGIWISAISLWEVSKKVQKGQLVLDRPLRQWLNLATRIRGLYVADLSGDILIESCELPPPFHGDPADQMIVATVRHFNGRLITKDRQLHQYAHVACVW